jgi:hypothetical protein
MLYVRFALSQGASHRLLLQIYEIDRYVNPFFWFSKKDCGPLSQSAGLWQPSRLALAA